MAQTSKYFFIIFISIILLVDKTCSNINILSQKPSLNEDPVTIPQNDFHTLLQYTYLKDTADSILNYANGYKDLSRPRGNILDFSDGVKDSSSYFLQISSTHNFDFSDTKIIRDLEEKQYVIKNLKLGQKIFYRAAENEEGLNNAKIYELTTNTLPPRNLDIPRVDNARDIGGVKTNLVENGIVKQGLFFRSAEIDYIEEEGKKVVIDLGIKVEIDLREPFYNRGPYVDGVKYYPISMTSDGEDVWFEQFEEQYVKIFDLIAEADINPITIHCSHGADRTGIIAFGLLSLLGCEYEDMARDFCFTNFAQQGTREFENFIMWWDKLAKFEGETTAEKSKSWLMSKGIEESKLEHIRAIFIDGYKEKTSSNNEQKDKLKNGNKTKINGKNFFQLLDEDKI